MDIVNELRKTFGGDPFSPALNEDRCWLHVTQTPAHTYYQIIYVMSDQRRFASITARDSFSEPLAREVVQSVRKTEGDALPDAVDVIEGFRCDPFEFDCAGILAPAAHSRYTHQCPRLQPHCYVAFPMYRCEFSGKESPDEAHEMWRNPHLVNTIDWTRAPTPKLLVCLPNSQVSPPRFDLTNAAELLSMARQSPAGEEVLVQNAWGMEARITATRIGFTATSGDHTQRLPFVSGLRSWIQQFGMGRLS